MNSSVDITNPSIKLLTAYLIKRSYTVREVRLKRHYVEFTAPNGKVWLTKPYFVGYPFIPPTAVVVANDKAASYEFAAENGAVVPRTLNIPGEEKKLDSFRNSYAPLIVKPLHSFGSHGLSLGIQKAHELDQAIKRAQRYSPKVLVQQQFIGEEVRFTILRGTVAHCLLRQTPQVIGDGVSTVRQLIAQENLERQSLKAELVPYPLLDESLIPRQYLTDDSIPEADEIVEFSKSTLVAGGAVMRDVTGSVHDSYKVIAQRLGVALSSDFIVVDMLIADYRIPASDQNYVFLEYSVAPSLRLYYEVRSGHDFDIVGKLSDMIKEWSDLYHGK